MPDVVIPYELRLYCYYIFLYHILCFTINSNWEVKLAVSSSNRVLTLFLLPQHSTERRRPNGPCLTAYPASFKKKPKVVLVLAMRTYEGSGGIAPLFLNLDARWRWVGNVTSRPFYSRQRPPFPFTLWLGCWVGPRGGLDDLEKREISSPCRDSNPGPSLCSVCNFYKVFFVAGNTARPWSLNFYIKALILMLQVTAGGRADCLCCTKRETVGAQPP